ncbi:MAG: toxin-antitoxin system HicB family antitoxin [Candidatus Bathyarchaeia archaeon]
MGKRVRIPKELHEELEAIAERRGISVNDLANELLESVMD